MMIRWSYVRNFDRCILAVGPLPWEHLTSRVARWLLFLKSSVRSASSRSAFVFLE